MDFVRDQLSGTDPNSTVLTSRISKNIIKDGDLVILYIRHDSLDHMYVKKGQILQNRFGKFYHDEIIGKPFGTMIKSFYNEGYLYVLRPTPELWCDAVHTRTQIVNELDSSIIIFHLDIYPGSVVVESGTGSGCMTSSIARTVSPNGRVHTFEYNKVRADTARQEFQQLGMSHLVHVTCHDVCGKLDPSTAGFPGVAPETVDAVFLDLPEPWHAIHHARMVLKSGKSICCYSPCIEQCIKTFEALRRDGFHSIRMIEVRQRPFDGRRIEIEQLDLGSPEGQALQYSGQEHGGGKKAKGVDSTDVNGDGNEMRSDAKPHPRALDNSFPKYVPVNMPAQPVNVMRAISSMKGHTAFLTFAIKAQTDADGDFGDLVDGEGEAGTDKGDDDGHDGRDEEFGRVRERQGKGRDKA